MWAGKTQWKTFLFCQMVSSLLLKTRRDGASTTSVTDITLSVTVKSTWHHFSLVLWPASRCYGRDRDGLGEGGSGFPNQICCCS